MQEIATDNPPVRQPGAANARFGGSARYLISDLCSDLESYLAPEQIQEVYRAYLFSAEAHEGQSRLSGEPYIYHPVAVARILAGLRMDHQCLMAAILHDVIEDTETAKEQLAEQFGPGLAELVDGVSKLTQIKFRSRAEAQAENFRKMLLAMTRDIRVILIKLADRLHNMRTLGVMPPGKARRIARETLEIYAPIANRLGINSMRHELQDLGMAAYWPWRHRVLSQSLRTMRGNRKEVLGRIETGLRRRLRQEGLPGEVYGREKHVYSIYRKMREKHASLADLADVYAFRVVVDKVDTCYRVLGAVHNLYKPMPGRFKDYIAIPKANGYQSLHTVLFGPQGLPIEIQIRTEEMHRVSEEGIAAHWHYKSEEADGSPPANAAAWLRDLLELQKGSGDSMEFLEHVKVDLFPDEVYVFTPRGKILVLPKGATVIDFAYAVHSDVGNQCVAALVDRRLSPLRTRLNSGQSVEIITKEDGRPNPAWLDFVVTGKARAAIRSYLKRLEKEEAARLGRRLLERELEPLGLRVEQVDEERIDRALREFNAGSFDQVLREIGLGNRMAKLVARLLSGDGEATAPSDDERAGALSIQGTEGMVVRFAKCCGPIPGDPILANFSPGRGVVVHHQNCPNLGDFRKQGQSWLDVQWSSEVQGEYITAIRVDVGNQRGMLATVASIIAEEGSNIEDVRSEERDGLSSSLRFVIAVRDRRHLANIIKRIRALPAVLRIARVIG